MHGPDGDMHITLRDAIHVARLPYNLISLARVARDRIETTLTTKLTIRDCVTGRILGTGTREGNLYYVNATGICATHAYTAISAWDLHEALGHIGTDSIRQLASGMVLGLHVSGPIPDKFDCARCIQGKHTHTAQPKKSTCKIKEIGEVIVSDVMGGGTNLPEGLGGIHYVVTFTDMRTKFTICYYLKQKSEVLDALKKFVAWFENHANKQIKFLFSDMGGEYVSTALKDFCALKGIQTQNTAHYLPAQNGSAEHVNWTLTDHIIAMMAGANLPCKLWPYAVAHFTWIKNRLLTRGLAENMMPYKALFGKKPKFGHLVPFGQKIWVLDEHPGRAKFDPRSCQFPFLGFTDDPGIVKYWDGARALTSRNVNFSDISMKNTNANEHSTLMLEGEKCHPFDSLEWISHEQSERMDENGMESQHIQPDAQDRDTGTGGDEGTRGDAGDVGTGGENVTERSGGDDGSRGNEGMDSGGDPENEVNAELRREPKQDTRIQPAPPTRQSTRLHNQPRLNYQTMHNHRIDAAKNESQGQAFLTNVPTPNNFKEATESEYATEWMGCM
jgi:hypothetical protein